MTTSDTMMRTRSRVTRLSAFRDPFMMWKPAKADWHRVDAIPLLGTGKIDLAAVKRLARTFYA